LLTIPSSLLLITLGQPLLGAVYQSGHFNAYDTSQSALALSCYSLGLVAFTSARILSPAFYALSDARTPMLVSVSSIALNLMLPPLFLRVWHMRFEALALTTACAVDWAVWKAAICAIASCVSGSPRPLWLCRCTCCTTMDSRPLTARASL